MERRDKTPHEAQRGRLIRARGVNRILELPEIRHVIRRLAGFAILLVSAAGAQNWDLVLSVTSDTLVPYEPVHARAMFVSKDTLPVRLPASVTYALKNSLGLSLTAADGREFRIGEEIQTTSDPMRKPPDFTLPPQESLLSNLDELSTWQRVLRDSGPEPLPAGKYELQAVSDGHESNVVNLVVRDQRDLSPDVVQSYREILRCSSLGAEVSYFRGGLAYHHSIVSELARQVVQDDSVGRFYGIDAQIRLMRSTPRNPYDPVTGKQQIAAARDRALNLYRSLGFRYPDSPTATFYFLHGLPEDSASAILRAVATKFPNSVLEREAKLTLTKLDIDQRRAKK